MIAIVCGLAAATAWAAAGICASRTSIALGAWNAVAWITIVGLLALLPALVVVGWPGYDANELHWFLVAGLGSVFGLAAIYRAMQRIQVGVAVGIAAGEGAVAALIGIAFGAATSLLMLTGVLIVLVGILALARAQNSTAVETESHRTEGYGWALVSSLLFGIALYATNRLAIHGPAVWSVAAPRIVGPILIAVPQFARGHLRMTPAAAPWAVCGGLTELAGFLAVAIGSRHSLVVTDVLSSQFVVFTAIGAAVFLGERLALAQRRSILVVALGAALVAASA
jgi:drug/metabolite transporter (DMT)-like permease